MPCRLQPNIPWNHYFIVEVTDGEETPLDETFLTEEEAIVGIEKLNAKSADQ